MPLQLTKNQRRLSCCHRKGFPVRISSSALLLALAVSIPIGFASADPAAAPRASATVAADNGGDQVVCRTSAAATGTRLGAVRECHSQREWDRMRQEEQNQLTRVQIQRGNSGSGG
jgi:hypothetical protein